MANYINGQQGTVTVAGTDWNCKEWSGSYKVTDITTTNTGNYDATTQFTWADRIPGIKSFEFSFTAGYDTTNKPDTALAAGKVVTFTLVKGGGAGSVAGTGLITGGPDIKSGNPDTEVEFTISVASKGVVTAT